MERKKYQKKGKVDSRKVKKEMEFHREEKNGKKRLQKKERDVRKLFRI